VVFVGWLWLFDNNPARQTTNRRGHGHGNKGEGSMARARALSLSLRLAACIIRTANAKKTHVILFNCNYDGITPVSVCSLLAFYLIVGQALAHTPPNQGRVGAMGRHAFGSFSASRRSCWAILRQCTRLCLLVDISYQAYHKTYLWIRLPYLLKKFLRFRATVDFVGFCVLASPEDRF
jgi:hypothetical protein